MQPNNKPVFFDLNKKRWPKVRTGGYIIGVFLSVIFLILIASILINPALESLSLPHSSFLPNGGHAIFNSNTLSRKKEGFAGMKKTLQSEKEKQKGAVVPHLGQKSGESIRMAYFVDWDDASFNSLKNNLNSLDVVAGEWLHLDDGAGNISEDNPEKQATVVSYIQERKPDTKIFALINNYDGQKWESDNLSSALSTPATRSKMVETIVHYVQNKGLQGISVDFESIHTADQGNMVEFLHELSAKVHENNLAITVNLPAHDDDFDYKKYAAVVDYIIVMAYDEHWSSSTAGPIASVDWFRSVLEKHTEEVAPEKMILAFGNYAYDWSGESKEAQVKTFEEAMLTAKESEGEVTIEENSLNPTFDYADDNNQIHHVWMLDATSIYNQMRIAAPFHTHGYALWRLGSEDPSLWSIFQKNELTHDDVQSIIQVAFKYNVDYEGQGEILRVTDTPRIGTRKIGFNDDTGLIDEMDYTTLPSSYVVSRYGFKHKELALTFDDGPDPSYTPKILDILKKYQIPATFFVIGNNSEKYPEIVRRIYDEGHDIGNHTFTHPNIEDISDLSLRLEISSMERLLETITGHSTVLFRSPYAEDSEPDTTDEVKPMEKINNLGYITVGMQIDPKDWQAPGIQKIVDSTILQAEKQAGNVILMHDAGGERSQTIAALPLIIEALQKKGYTFVSVSGLLGKKRSEIMPEITKNDQMFRFSNNIGFDIIEWFHWTMSFLFIVGIILGLARLLLVTSLALYQRYGRKEVFLKNLDTLSVAVIVPAYNEEKVINQTIASLLASRHPKRFEIVVVDDGSTDATYETVHSAYGENKMIQIYKILNSGKPEALNFGLTKTEADVVITLDADTVFSKDTIMNLVRHFEDDTVGAVAGNAKVGNRLNLLTRWQALEYIVSQNLDRRAFVILNCITVVPGAVGAWRTTLVKQARGFSSHTLAEDSDLTIEIGKLGYKILYEENAIGLTEAPDSVKAFVNQRYRWMFGTFQVFWKHRSMLFRPKYGWLGCFALPNIFLYQIIFPLVSPIMDLLMVLTLISFAMDRWQHPLSASVDSLERILFYYALFLAVDYITGFIAFSMEKNEDKTLLIWLFFQRFFYRQLMYFVAIKSILSSLKGHEVGWNKLERKATVTFEQ